MRIEMVQMACTSAITAAKAPTFKAPFGPTRLPVAKAGICSFEVDPGRIIQVSCAETAGGVNGVSREL
jgi:hypothetical protein